MALNPLYIKMLSRLDDYSNDLSKYISLSLLCSYFPGTSPLAQSCVGLETGSRNPWYSPQTKSSPVAGRTLVIYKTYVLIFSCLWIPRLALLALDFISAAGVLSLFLTL